MVHPQPTLSPSKGRIKQLRATDLCCPHCGGAIIKEFELKCLNCGRELKRTCSVCAADRKVIHESIHKGIKLWVTSNCPECRVVFGRLLHREVRYC